MINDDDNVDQESTYFNSEYKETPAIPEPATQVGYNLRSGRNETPRKETEDVSLT